MSEQSILRSPKVVAGDLDVSPATLRRWSDEFQKHLSDEATGSDDERDHRRYKDEDITTLLIVKELMNDGLTYEQVRLKLNDRHKVRVEPDDIVTDTETLERMLDTDEIEGLKEKLEENEENQALVASNGTESPAIAFLNNTLTTLSDSQKSILNSQAANRELLGVLLQDNFNLKEENNRLRERILEVERQVSQSRQEDEQRREALRQELESKITAANKLAGEAMTAAQSVEVPQIKAIESKPGCLGMLLGGGGTQFVTVPQRRSVDERGPSARLKPPPAGGPSLAPNHPKPLFPPE